MPTGEIVPGIGVATEATIDRFVKDYKQWCGMKANDYIEFKYEGRKLAGDETFANIRNGAQIDVGFTPLSRSIEISCHLISRGE